MTGKAELTVEEIARQRRPSRLLGQGFSRIGRIVDATGFPEETVARALDVVIRWLRREPR